MIWKSFDHPTDTFLPGQILSKDQELFSSMSISDYSTGIIRLKMQSDSNLKTDVTLKDYVAIMDTALLLIMVLKLNVNVHLDSIMLIRLRVVTGSILTLLKIARTRNSNSRMTWNDWIKLRGTMNLIRFTKSM